MLLKPVQAAVREEKGVGGRQRCNVGRGTGKFDLHIFCVSADGKEPCPLTRWVLPHMTLCTNKCI